MNELRNAAIFREAVRKARAAREHADDAPIADPARPGELAELESEIAEVNEQIGLAYSSTQALGVLCSDQLRQAGSARLREEHEGCHVLTKLSERTTRDLERAKSRLEQLTARRTKLQVRRQEILTGRRCA